MEDNFNKNRKGTGTKEWSEFSYNIQNGCKNNCIYCYARHEAYTKYKSIESLSEWTNPMINERKVNAKHPKRDGIIMFPTTHDIYSGNVHAAINTLKNILSVGNKVLIVSKPEFNTIEKICKELKEYKELILFRFTIGSTNDFLLKWFEPNAPDFNERALSLSCAYHEGYKTSLSCEPLLGGLETFDIIYDILSKFVTNDIWIGKMNKIDERIFENLDIIKKMINHIKYYQTDDEVMRIYNKYKNDPKISWKDSFKQVISKYEK